MHTPICSRFQLLQTGDLDLLFPLIAQNHVCVITLHSTLIYRLHACLRTNNPGYYIISICVSRLCINRRSPHQQNTCQNAGQNPSFHVIYPFSFVNLINNFRLSCFRASAYIKQYVKKPDMFPYPVSLNIAFQL